ncbi:hypothetical protein EV421DRAFT_2041012 [Armillaria borealis]|uniref:Heterokaryon incompatibility domain-containing protein n=1 Tax=Armillaria borealis TaxID=47425 RepID=A0AA39IXS8_9AGAR|nr:hypothetical protein EV421DRAFT_2041012 [Armillaria borealis]
MARNGAPMRAIHNELRLKPVGVAMGFYHCMSAATWDYGPGVVIDWQDSRGDINYENLPKVTLSALREIGKEESAIPVPEQRRYTGRKPVLPTALADIPCTRLGVDGLLDKLNSILGTSYTLNTHSKCFFADTLLKTMSRRLSYSEATKSLSLHSILKSYIAQNYDFGTAYAHLRLYWYDISTARGKLYAHKKDDRNMRPNVLADGWIIRRKTPPRRVWDLYANRVVPFWAVRKHPWAVSHAWVSDEERVDVWTPINGCEWPVPIPKDSSLDLIRIEMLNLGAEYAWVDVLCLRQEHGIRDAKRAQEWQLDVPTIGYVYQWADQVVCYFSGLGRPLNFKPGDFENDRRWFRRAWTLQEISKDPIIGGRTEGLAFVEEDLQARFQNELASLHKMRMDDYVFDFLLQMQNRVSTNPMDKVAGLVYLFYPKFIPIYDAVQSEEDAWTVLVNMMRVRPRADLLFTYPEPGNGRKCWRPSWEQAMTTTLPSHVEIEWVGKVNRLDTTNGDMYIGPYIDSGYVRGFADECNKGKCRQGELIIEDNTRTSHSFNIVKDHA